MKKGHRTILSLHNSKIDIITNRNLKFPTDVNFPQNIKVVYKMIRHKNMLGEIYVDAGGICLELKIFFMHLRYIS